MRGRIVGCRDVTGATERVPWKAEVERSGKLLQRCSDLDVKDLRHPMLNPGWSIR